MRLGLEQDDAGHGPALPGGEVAQVATQRVVSDLERALHAAGVAEGLARGVEYEAQVGHPERVAGAVGAHEHQRVAGDPELDVGLLGADRVHRLGRPHDVADVDDLRREVEFARLGQRQRLEVVDQVAEMVGLLAEDPEQLVVGFQEEVIRLSCRD